MFYRCVTSATKFKLSYLSGKTGNFETVNSNNKKLLNTLEKMVKQLDLPYSYQQALTEADFR